MTAISAVRASVVANLVAAISARKLPADELLRRHGLSAKLLEDPYAVVPMARYVALFEDAARTIGDFAIGARLGATIQPADMGPLGVLFAMSSSARRALERLSRYSNSLQSDTTTSLHGEADDLILSYRIADAAIWPRRQDAEYTLATCCQLIRSSFLSSWAPLEVHFEHAEHADRAVLARIFRAPIVFGQSCNRLVMNASEIERDHRTEDADLAHILERHIGDLVAEDAAGCGLKDKVAELIGISMGHRPMTLGSLAADLGISPRTLQRRLAEEGTSVRELVRRHRQSIANQHLARQDVNLSRLALSLGYADGTAFWRAYKSWTGHPPSRARPHSPPRPDGNV